MHNKAFNIAKNEKYDGYQRGLTSIVYNFFDKRTEGWVKSNNTQNNELVEELRKPIIGRFRKPWVHSSFTDNIWSDDLIYMQLLSKVNKLTGFLLCVIGFIVNFFGLFLWMIKKVLQLLIFFKKY